MIRGAFADLTQSSGAEAQWVDSLLIRFGPFRQDLLVDTRDPETHIFAPRKLDGWKMQFPSGMAYVHGRAVSFREDTY